jgi:hypothetical protein
MFTWCAKLSDGAELRQFEDHIWDLLMSNPDIPIPHGLNISTDSIPRDKVVQFTIFPIALTKRICPWFSQEGLCYNQFVDPDKEDLLAYWLVDDYIIGGPGVSHIARQVLGVRDRETGKRNLTVVSPTGVIWGDLDKDDLSFEEE